MRKKKEGYAEYQQRQAAGKKRQAVIAAHILAGHSDAEILAMQSLATTLEEVRSVRAGVSQ